jgi:hypothetical protein
VTVTVTAGNFKTIAHRRHANCRFDDIGAILESEPKACMYPTIEDLQ